MAYLTSAMRLRERESGGAQDQGSRQLRHQAANVGGKPAVPANDPYSSVFKASEIVLLIDLRNKSNFYIGLGVLQGNFVELLMFS
jgi:hypothetical protein